MCRYFNGKIPAAACRLIGDLYTVSNKLPAFRLPVFSYDVIQVPCRMRLRLQFWRRLSLLSCVVADGMIGGKHRSNTELVAQGAGNISFRLFGGIPATGAIAYRAMSKMAVVALRLQAWFMRLSASDSGNSDAVCVDPDADHRGNLVYGCLTICVSGEPSSV